MADNSKVLDNKKYFWDGINYESENAAKENFDKYSKDGFETKLVEEEGKYFIYTRRIAKEIKAEGNVN
ncbi:MAG: hypothetical protein AB1775_08010 [Bacteroidota bacterium]